MADTQRFEGPSIEQVLSQVRRTLGSDAEIIEANKVRKGGIGGFFAKETFEVTAAASTPASGAASLPAGIDEAAFDRAAAHVREASLPRTPGGIASLLDLADSVSASERQDTVLTSADTAPSFVAAPTPPRTRAEMVAQQVMAEHLRSAGPATGVMATFEPLLTGDLPRISTEGTAFTDVLNRMAADAGPEIARALDGRLPGEPIRPATPAPSDPPSTTSWLQARAEALAAEPTAHQVIMPAAAAVPDGVLDRIVDVDPVDGVVLEQVSDRTVRLLSWLERDNLPRTTLMAALRGLPQMPALPETTGLVVAVVGERRRALQLCKQLAKACEADPSTVVLASRTYSGKGLPESQRIVDVTDATRERLSWRRRAQPTFVAVECPPRLGADSHTWTRAIVDSLQAHQVIGVVTASRKVEDVRRWVEVVGGVDGLALEHLEETSTPYAVLALEIPVAFLDAVPASPGSWAQALMEGAPA